MVDENYRVGERQRAKEQKRRRRRRRSIALVIFLILLAVGIIVARTMFKPKTSIKQGAAHVTKVSYAVQTKHYTEPDFTIDLPATWQQLPPPSTTYRLYRWQSPDRVTKGQVIDVYEDTIPVNFAVNRGLIIDGSVDHITQEGAASDNCANFTKGLVPVPGHTGVPAKWQGIDFLCDQGNVERDVIGTSSKDAINTVVLRTSLGVTHKFFFTYTDYAINPDYTVFYNALQSFHMQ